MAAGVALVGAGVLVAGPITAPPDIRVAMPTIRVDSPNVRLAYSPFDDYQFIFGSAIENAMTVLSTPGPGPAAVLQHVLQSQPATAQAITQALKSAVPAVLEQLTSTMPLELRHALNSFNDGNYAAAVNTLLGIDVAVLRPVLMTNPALASVVVGILGPVISGLSATVEAVEDIGDAWKGGPSPALEALVRAPAIIADGVLNGGYGPNFNPDPASPTVVLAGGLFSPGSSAPGRVVLPGPIATLTGHGPNPADFATDPADADPMTLSLTVGDPASSQDDVQKLGTGGQQAQGVANAVSGGVTTAPTTKKVTKRPIRNAISGVMDDVRGALKKFGDSPKMTTGEAGKTSLAGKNDTADGGAAASGGAHHHIRGGEHQKADGGNDD
jgi:hypothetical protein